MFSVGGVYGGLRGVNGSYFPDLGKILGAPPIDRGVKKGLGGAGQLFSVKSVI